MQRFFCSFILSFLITAPAWCLSPSPSLEPTSVIYGVVPPFFGGEPLRDVTKRIPELQSLGVNVISISPLQQTDDKGALSYSITDYLTLRKDFGTDDDLNDLVTAAHNNGIKVIIDFVPNHTSDQHPFFLDAQKNGPSSPYYTYYQRDKNGNYQYYFDWVHLPNLNYKNPEVLKMMEGAFTHWLTKYSIDGFRVNVAWGIHDRAPKFWLILNKKLKEIRPDLIMIAEASARDPYYKASGFDLAYDWGQELGKPAWEKVFDSEQGLSGRLDVELKASANAQGNILRFLNNNDTGPRFITKYGIQKLRVASVLQFTLPGAVLLYSGDEVGAEYEPTKNPGVINWSDSKKLTEFYKNLIRVRQTLPGLKSLDWSPVATDPNGAVYGYLRGKDNDQVLVVLNFGPKVIFELDPAMADLNPNFAQSEKFHEVLSGREISVRHENNKILIDIPKNSALILSAPQY